MDATRRDRAKRIVITLVREIGEEIDRDPDVSVLEAADHIEVPPSTLYRWLANAPAKVDAAAIAALADWLHDEHGYEDFAARWRRISRQISS